MRSSSNSKTLNKTENKTTNASNEGGTQFVNSNGNSVVMTDFDSVELSFKAIEELSTDAFDFAEKAMNSVGDASERSQTANTQAIGTLKDFAETLKVGDLKVTKTIYLAGLGLIGAIVISTIVISANKKKAGK